MTYNPETAFQTEDNMVYNLRQEGWRKGQPVMRNDVYVVVNMSAPSLDKQREIVAVIQKALNEAFPVKS